jgi:hypothetical protein
MNKTSNKTNKKSRVHVAKKDRSVSPAPGKKVGLPAFIEPNAHDIMDELSMLDSYKYQDYNN